MPPLELAHGHETPATSQTHGSGRVRAPRVDGRANAHDTQAHGARTDAISAAPVERRAVRKIRFSGAEWALVEERARACGRPPARYVRDVTLGAVPKVSRPRANAPLIRDLGALAAAVQRIQRTATTLASGTVATADASPTLAAGEAGSALDAALVGVVDDILALVRRLA
ncbi:MAG: hypothetical protein MUE41_01260 [Gemmatimonadaceae bacterium]|jgi:hypothetical protein|nr:hypothetical protein [Gemmatimonadaceae bacterium]